MRGCAKRNRLFIGERKVIVQSGAYKSSCSGGGDRGEIRYIRHLVSIWPAEIVKNPKKGNSLHLAWGGRTFSLMGEMVSSSRKAVSAILRGELSRC